MKWLTTFKFCIVLSIIFQFSWSDTAHALDFAIFPLEELAESSDTIVIGSVMKSRKAEDNYRIYQVTVEQPIKGNKKKSELISVKVLQWADEGILDRGKQYLLLLNEEDSVYKVNGVHQGFILMENGSTKSRFYSKEEVNRFFQDHAVEVDFKNPRVPGFQFLPMVFIICVCIGLFFLQRRKSGK
jgi:hypothetical protein